MSIAERGASVNSVRCSKIPLVALVLVLATAPARAQVQNLTGLQLRSATDSAQDSTEDSTPDALQPSPGVSDEKTPARPAPPGAKPPPRRKAGDLPPLRPYPSAQRKGQRGGPGEPTPSPTATPSDPAAPPGPTVAVPEPPPARRKIPADPNPFDPVGLRVGDIDVKPYVEQDVGYASNPLGATSAPKGSGLETTEAGAAWQSQWSRNDFHGQLKGGYTDYFETPDASGAYGSGTVDGRIDATRDLAFDAEGRFSVLPQPLSNFGVTIPGGGSPYIETATWGATLGGVQKFGDLSIGLHGAFDQQSYQNAPLSATDAQNLSADDYEDWSLKLKTAYRVSEAVSPYVEVDVDTRRYANGLDALGYEADSDGLSVLAGVTVSFSQMLNGELALGYGERSYQDPRLPHASAPLIDASLIWTATPLTTLTLKANTAINDAIIANASADINHSYSIDLSHALTRQFTLGLTGTYGTDEYVGNSQTDQTWSVAAKAEYHITRDIVFKVTATHSAYVSNEPGQNSTNNMVMVGVKLQR
jgi:hypothetical protein